jgi:hypothetical protein
MRASKLDRVKWDNNTSKRRRIETMNEASESSSNESEEEDHINDGIDRVSVFGQQQKVTT